MALVILRAALLLISFTGLCAFIRGGLKINRFIAPFMAVSGIICALMFGGMLHILKPVCYALYGAGFAGFAYTYFIRRVKPDYPLISAMAVFCAVLGICFYSLPLLRNDDFSHWGMVARHLLRYDAFPDSSAPWVHFQAYPLGSAAFIYYAARMIGNTEGMYLVGQMFLTGPALLTLMAFVDGKRENHRAMYIVWTIVFCLYFVALRMLETLLVDVLLSLMGIGIAACAIYYKNDFKRACLAALPGIVAIVYIKNSGLFFSAAGSVLLGYAAMKRTGKKRSAWLGFIAAMGIAAGAYLLWTLHIKLDFPAALDTKHAVSLSAYAQEAGSKGISDIIAIIKSMGLGMLKFPQVTPLAAVIVPGAGWLICAMCRRMPDGQEVKRRALKNLALSAGVYALWLIMIFFMYVFSMPLGEALEAAGFERYNGTGVFYLTGLILMILLPLFAREEIDSLRPMHFLHRAAPVICAVILAASFIWQPPTFDREYTSRSGFVRENLQAAREEYHLEDGQKYMFFCDRADPVMGMVKAYYLMQYEFETADIQIIGEKNGKYQAGTYFDRGKCSDIQAFIGEHIDECGALFMLNPSENFEAELEAYMAENDCGTPIVRIYE